jgi:hypothetical protein
VTRIFTMKENTMTFSHLLFGRRAACALLLVAACAVASCSGGATGPANEAAAEMPPESVVGVYITSVGDAAPAKAAGLAPGDIVLAISETPTPDIPTFDKALSEKVKAGAPYELVYLRGRKLSSISLTGPFTGVEGRRWVGPLELIMRLQSHGQVDKAKMAYDLGMSENKLDPAHSLVARIIMVGSGTSVEEEAQRASLVDELSKTASAEDLKQFGYHYFMANGFYAAAATAFEKYLEQRPDDFSARLNRAVALTYSGRLADAEREVARVDMDSSGKITPQGQQMKDQVYALSALEKKDYKGAVQRFEALLQREPPKRDFSHQLRYVFALIKAGETAKANAEIEKLKATAGQFQGIAYQVSLLEAFALETAGKRAEAAAVAAAGDPVIPDPVIDFWKQTPGGDEILTAWSVLRAGTN